MSIIFVNWLVILFTFITMWVIYGIGLSKISKSDIIFNSNGKKIIYEGSVLRLDALVANIYQLMQNMNQNKLNEFKEFLDDSTESTDLEDNHLQVYPSIYPDKGKNYIIKTNNSFGFVEIYEKSSDLIHVGLQLLFPIEAKKNQSMQLKLLENIFSVIKPKYGNPFAQDNNMMVFKDNNTICIVLHDERKIDSTNDTIVLTVRIFNKKYWDPENIQVQSLGGLKNLMQQVPQKEILHYAATETNYPS